MDRTVRTAICNIEQLLRIISMSNIIRILDNQGNGCVADRGNITASKSRVTMEWGVPYARIVVVRARCSQHASV